MTITTRWNAKDPIEQDVAQFTFALGAGETLSNATVQVTVLAGTDATPANVLNGAVTLSSVQGIVYQPFKGGLDGVIYKMKCIATTSAGRVLAVAGELPVKEY
jgi:hypothetical protein